MVCYDSLMNPNLATLFENTKNENQITIEKKFVLFNQSDWKRYFSSAVLFYNSQLQILNNFSTTHNLTNNDTKSLEQYLMLNYLKKIFSPTWDNTLNLVKLKQFLNPYEEEMKKVLGAEKRICTPDAVSSLCGFIRYKTSVLGENNNDMLENYKTSKLINLHSYRLPVQMYFLNLCPDKSTSAFGVAFGEFKNSIDAGENRAFVENLFIQEINTSFDVLNKKSTLENTNGSRLSWQELLLSNKGKYIFIDFWASWCMPCRAQFPSLRKIKNEFKNKPIIFISISIDENKDDWIIASKSENLSEDLHNYLLLNVKRSELAKLLKLNSVPRIVLIDKNSRMIAKDFYKPTEIQFKKELNKIIQ